MDRKAGPRASARATPVLKEHRGRWASAPATECPESISLNGDGGLIWESGWVSMGQVCCSNRLALHPQWFHRENTFSLMVEIQSGPWGPGEERWRTVHGPPVLG